MLIDFDHPSDDTPTYLPDFRPKRLKYIPNLRPSKTESNSYVFLFILFLLKARLHRRFLSQQLNATQCNFCRAEVAMSCDFIAILVQFVSVNISTRLLLKQKLCAC